MLISQQLLHNLYKMHVALNGGDGSLWENAVLLRVMVPYRNKMDKNVELDFVEHFSMSCSAEDCVVQKLSLRVYRRAKFLLLITGD